MDENQDVRNALMQKFNLPEADAEVAKPPVEKPDVNEVVEPTAPLPPSPAGDEAYEPKGDSPPVSDLLEQVIENSKVKAEEDSLTPAERSKIAKLCVDESIIRGILGD